MLSMLFPCPARSVSHTPAFAKIAARQRHNVIMFTIFQLSNLYNLFVHIIDSGRVFAGPKIYV